MSTRPESPPRVALIQSASSDIGLALSRRWLERGWRVGGTFRTPGPAVDDLARAGAHLVPCDLLDSAQVDAACAELGRIFPAWDVLVLGAGTQDPVGPFAEGAFEEWEASIRVNFTAQLRVVHALLPTRRREAPHGPCVLFFAGGGTNNATTNYSAYTISKIALIKMCELLDAEIPDTRFSILGPGWVKTKIHQATLLAGERAGPNFRRTVEKLAGEECTSMQTVLDCCDWVLGRPREVVGGRNFSVVFDRWQDVGLEALLKQDSDMYKLRRAGNGARLPESPFLV